MYFVLVFILHIGAYLAIGLCLSSLAFKYNYIPKQFILTVAFGSIAFLYYIVFFLSLLNPAYGKFFNIIIYILGVTILLYGFYKLKVLIKNKSFVIYVLLPLSIITVVLGYYSILLRDCRVNVPANQQYSNASYCYLSNLPDDNSLPLAFAQNIEERTPKALLGGWRLVDRPPIQIGAGLAVLELTNKQADISRGYQIIATFLQLGWIAAVFGLLITLGLKLKHTILLIGTMTFVGVIFINSVFVWPKLFSASLVVAGCALLLDFSNKNRAKFVFSSIILVSLGLLIHDNVIFTLLGLVTVLAYLVIRNIISKSKHKTKTLPWKSVFIGCVVAILILTPWAVYKEKISSSDRLVKWQFAGVIKPDNRSTISTLIDSYSNISFDKWIKNREINLETMVKPILSSNLSTGIKSVGFSKSSLRFSLSNLSTWYEENDFFVLLFALGFFNLGWVILLLRKQPLKFSSLQKYLLATSLIGIVFWVILMFIPGSTIIHQGSYATLLILFCLFGNWLARTRLLYVLFFIQFLLFNTFWVLGVFTRYNVSLRRAWLDVIASLLVAIYFVIVSKATAVISLTGKNQEKANGRMEKVFSTLFSKISSAKTK